LIQQLDVILVREMDATTCKELCEATDEDLIKAFIYGKAKPASVVGILFSKISAVVWTSTLGPGSSRAPKQPKSGRHELYTMDFKNFAVAAKPPNRKSFSRKCLKDK
jgi:hypothetical protein